MATFQLFESMHSHDMHTVLLTSVGHAFYQH